MSASENGMMILAHRGYWKLEKEKNTRVAFERAFDNSFGVETDLRDICGTLVISHNMPNGDEMTFEEFLKILDGRNIPIALNIKADGQSEEIQRLITKYDVKNYFTFDMSIPEMVVQHKSKLTVFTGMSDIVNYPIMLNEAHGVWLDSFYSDWFGEKEILDLINKKKQVCIVSPDLHGREYRSIWKKYKNIPGIMICTDHPDEAEEYFNGQD